MTSEVRDEPIRAMCDASCPKCRTHIGWCGTALDRPPCPRCGHQVARDVLEHDHRLMEEAREMMSADSPETRSGKTEAVWLQDWRPRAFIYAGRKHPKLPKADGLFGNPFSHSAKSSALVKVDSIEDAVDHYRRWLIGDQSVAAMLPPEEESRRRRILKALPSIRGKRVACWRHDGPCHAQVLAELADGPLGEPIYESSPSEEPCP